MTRRGPSRHSCMVSEIEREQEHRKHTHRVCMRKFGLFSLRHCQASTNDMSSLRLLICDVCVSFFLLLVLHRTPGTHYSSAATVLYYLIRMEPFTKYNLHLQGGSDTRHTQRRAMAALRDGVQSVACAFVRGTHCFSVRSHFSCFVSISKFDHADRLFFDLGHTWTSASSQGGLSDVKVSSGMGEMRWAHAAIVCSLAC